MSGETNPGRLFNWLALVMLACLFPLFFVGGPGWSAGPLIKSAWDLGHPIFFALLTLYVRPWRFVSGLTLWILSSAAVFALGLGIELVQSLGGRDVQGRDLFRNLTGLWIILALRPKASFGKALPSRDWLLRALAAALLCIDLVLVSRVALQQAQVMRQLPDLYDFRNENPERFWRGNVTRSTGQACGSIAENPLSIALTTRRYSGASLDNLPSDWRGYDQLAIVFWNPESYTISLTLRINDLAHEQGRNIFHDRFNRTFRIEPGINRIKQDLSAVARAPTEREMDMDDVRRLMFFTSNLSQPARLCLGKLRLTDADDGSAVSD